MVIVALIGNLLIGMVCLFVAWQLWQLKRRLATVADTLLSVERSVHNVLYDAPDYIYKGQTGINQLRQKYRQLEPQFQRAQQAIALLGVGQALWRRSLPLVQSRSGKRTQSKRR